MHLTAVITSVFSFKAKSVNYVTCSELRYDKLLHVVKYFDRGAKYSGILF